MVVCLPQQSSFTPPAESESFTIDEASSSSCGRMPCMASIKWTSNPKRVKDWANSQPIGPAAITASSVSENTDSFVR